LKQAVAGTHNQMARTLAGLLRDLGPAARETAPDKGAASREGGAPVYGAGWRRCG